MVPVQTAARGAQEGPPCPVDVVLVRDEPEAASFPSDRGELRRMWPSVAPSPWYTKFRARATAIGRFLARIV